VPQYIAEFWFCLSVNCDSIAVEMPRTLLVVDDEEAARYALRRIFAGEYKVLEADSVRQARSILEREPPDVILLDYGLPGEDGMQLLQETVASTLAPAVIMITAHGSERLAVEAMKTGAYDYLVKPYDIDEIRLAVEHAIEWQDLKAEVSGLRDRLAGEGDFGGMSGVSRSMRELFQTAQRVAASDLPVLILGESGTGKDLLAREIHSRSARSRQRFVALNCAALPESLVESELFGHEKGAFTQALAAHPGKFEQAGRGTLFLDEIGDMDLGTQAKILRAVESGSIERLGGTQPVPVDVRLISATNKSPETAIREGRFRQDLYFRLAAVTLFIPPLRDRREDIPSLVTRFWQDAQKKYARPGPELMPGAILRLQEEAWPGNVRQLRSTVERLFVLATRERADAEAVAAVLQPLKQVESSSSDAIFAPADFREARRRFEAEYIARKLRENAGNISRTAEAVGLARQHLQEKIKDLGIVS
jgi:DNA-binding NtrC family response regulator